MPYNKALKVAITASDYGTQDNFAAAIGRNGATVSRVINGENSLLTPEEKIRWARALKTVAKKIFPTGDVATGDVAERETVNAGV